MEKKFLSHLPARLVQCPTRWYIIFYQLEPSTGLRVKFIKTYDLNRIPDLRIRHRRANEIINDLNNKLLPTGWPYVAQEEEKAPVDAVLLSVAVEYAVDLINANTDRYNSHRTYNSRRRVFLQWLDQHEPGCTITDFNSTKAVMYMDYLVLQRKVTNNTFNNYLRDMKMIFKTIGSRYSLEGNAFAAVKKKRSLEKKRRPFTPLERVVVATAIREADYWLFVAVLLMYYCFIRASELRRMKFSMVNLRDGIIQLPASTTKGRRLYVKTIPTSIMPFFLDARFTNHPTNWFIFGKGGSPNGKEQISRNRFNKKTKAILTRLLRDGKLESIEGLSFYSWKDTGATDLMRRLPPQVIQQQMNHLEITTTMIYQKPDVVNYSFRELPYDLVTS